MKHYLKAIDYTTAIVNQCYWCISREYGKFDCQFNQGVYFERSCSKDDYSECPRYQRGQKIIEERGW